MENKFDSSSWGYQIKKTENTGSKAGFREGGKLKIEFKVQLGTQAPESQAARVSKSALPTVSLHDLEPQFPHP